MKKLAAPFRRAVTRLAATIRRRGRVIAITLVGTLLGVGLATVIVWAPPERAALLMTVLSPILTVVLGFALETWWKSRRRS